MHKDTLAMRTRGRGILKHWLDSRRAQILAHLKWPIHSNTNGNPEVNRNKHPHGKYSFNGDGVAKANYTFCIDSFFWHNYVNSVEAILQLLQGMNGMVRVFDEYKREESDSNNKQSLLRR